MGTTFRLRRMALTALAVACLAVLGACATPTPAPTPTLQPTYTPAPTSTPYPTQPPLPTGTPLPTFTPPPTLTPLPSATPTVTPEPTRPPAPTATPVVKSLTVEWQNLHYNCQNRCETKSKIPDTVKYIYAYGYRSFEFNLHVHNLTKDRTLAPLWYPVALVSDGATDTPGIAPLRLGFQSRAYDVYKRLPIDAQPTIAPGGEADWSFGFMLPGKTMYVKSIALTAWGETYAIDLKSRADSPGYGFAGDCGLVNPQGCPEGMPPWDPRL